jgi:hypothetical protein
MTQPGFDSRETSPGDRRSLWTKPSLTMFRNMTAYMTGTSDGRPTALGAREARTLARAREASAGRLVQARMSGIVDSGTCELRCLSSGSIESGRRSAS